MSQFSVEFFCLRVPNHFVEEPFCAVFQKISDREKIYEKEEGGGYRYSPSKIFCLKVLKSFVGELLGCLYFRVSKKVMRQRVLS